MFASGLRVALFSGNYNGTLDGANNALRRLVAYLLAHGADVRVYSPVPPHPTLPPLGDLKVAPSLPILGRTEYRISLGLPRRLRDEIRHFSPNIVHVSAPDPLGLQACRFAKQMGVPTVASLHTRFETYLDYYGLRLLRGPAEAYLRHFYRGVDLVLAPTPALVDSLRRWDLDVPIELWSRGVDRRIFSPRHRSFDWRREHGFADQEMILLFFGRIVMEKGLADFAQAVAELRNQGLPLRPLVIGDGPARKRFARMLGDSYFTGQLQDQALGRAVASADILLNPSRTEAFGNVNLEAMASGLAVVSADVESARALIDHGRTGMLVPPDAAEGYSSAVQLLLADTEKRRSLAQAAAAAATAWNWDASLASVLANYRKLIRTDQIVVAA